MDGQDDPAVEEVFVPKGTATGTSATKLLRKAHAILPDTLRDNPYTVPTLVALALVLMALPIRIYFGLVALGIAIGYSLVPEKSTTHTHSLIVENAVAGLFSEQTEQAKPSSDNGTMLCKSWKILIEDATRDLVNLWFIGISKDGGRADFHDAARSAAFETAEAVVRAIHTKTKDTLMLLLYGLTNSIVAHVSEYREWQTSNLPLDELVRQRRFKRKHFYNTPDEATRIDAALKGKPLEFTPDELAHVRRVSAFALERVLPKTELRGRLVFPLFKEIAASGAILGVIDRLSDPDWINMQIVQHLQRAPDTNAPSPGWVLVSLCVLRVKNVENAIVGSLACVLHVGGRRVRTQLAENVVEDQTRHFRISEHVARDVSDNFRIHIQLVESLPESSEERTYGYARLTPQFPDSNSVCVRQLTWLPITLRGNVKEDHSTLSQPQVLLSISVRTCIQSVDQAVHANEAKLTIPSEFVDIVLDDPSRNADSTNTTIKRGAREVPVMHSNADLYIETATKVEIAPASEEHSDNGQVRTDVLNVEADINTNDWGKDSASIQSNDLPAVDTENAMSAAFSKTTLLSKTPQTETQRVQSILRSQEAFAALAARMHDVSAPAYLQFLMNVDALRTTTQRLPGDFRISQRSMDKETVALLQKIRKDAADVFAAHFLPGSKYLIPLGDTASVDRMEADITRSDLVDNVSGCFVGGPVGAEIFHAAYEAVCSVVCTEFLDHTRLFESSSGSASPPLSASDGQSSCALSDVSFACRQPGPSECNREESPAGQEAQRLAAEIQTVRRRLATLKVAGCTADAQKAEIELNALISLAKYTQSAEGQSKLAHPSLLGANVHVSDADATGLFRITTNVSESCYIVTRSMNDFSRLQRRLAKQFPKVARISAPKSVFRSLEAFLSVLISDDILCQAKELQAFLLDNAPADVGAAESSSYSLLRSIVSSTTGLLASGATAANDALRAPFYTSAARVSSDTAVSAYPDAGQPRKSVSMGNLAQFQTTFHSQIPSDHREATMAAHGMSASHTHEAVDFEQSRAKLAFLEDLTEDEVSMVVEVCFALVTEVFDLQEPSMWLRKRLLGVFKRLLKQSYGDALARSLSKALHQAASAPVLDAMAAALRNAMYPEVPVGTVGAVAQEGAAPRMLFLQKQRVCPDPVRLEDERFATMVAARSAFVAYVTGPSAPIAFETMVGQYGATLGARRLFESLQNRAFNKALLYNVLDVVLALLLTETAAHSK